MPTPKKRKTTDKTRAKLRAAAKKQDRGYHGHFAGIPKPKKKPAAKKKTTRRRKKAPAAGQRAMF